MTRSRIFTIFSATAFFLLCVLLPAAVHAEKVTDDDFGYSLDIPECYTITSHTPDGMSYQFRNTILPIDFVLKIYPSDDSQKAETNLKAALDKLSAEYEGPDSFLWSETECAVSSFTTSKILNGKAEGWAVCVKLPQKNADLLLLCYAESKIAQNYQQFILSTLNSLSVTSKSYLYPGIITTYAFPEKQKKVINLSINGKQIQTEIDSEASLANNFIIDCEYSVLCLYAKSDKWKEAWCRYYKTIFRDSYSRLSKVAFDINSALYPSLIKSNPNNIEENFNQTLLSWVQTFDYKRGDKKSSDFTSVIDAIMRTGSDCDSRSMLMCILLKQNGIDSTLFISREYSHAVYGAAINAPGAKIETNGTEYLLGETTVKSLKAGLIAQEQSDTEKWIPVSFD